MNKNNRLTQTSSGHESKETYQQTPSTPTHNSIFPSRTVSTSTPFHITRNDPGDGLDPLAPHPVTSGGGFLYRPIIKYYTQANLLAVAEFESIVTAPLIERLLRYKYKSFCLVMTHAVYDPLNAVPVAILCAANFSVEHAEALIQTFDKLNCKHIRRLFCYKSISSTHTIKDDLRS